MAQSPAERQAARHRRLKNAGMERISVYADQQTADALRQLAREHGKTQADVLRLGILAAHRLLKGEVTLATAHAMPTKATPPPSPDRPRPDLTPEPPLPPECLSATHGEPWWPSNARQLLEDSDHGRR